MYSQPSAADLTVSLIGGIIVAILAYGAFPFVFLLFNPKLTFKGFRRVCFLVNFVVFIGMSLLDGTYNTGSYVLWTFVVTAILRNLHDFYSAEELKSEAEKKLAGQPRSGLKTPVKPAPENSREEPVIPPPPPPPPSPPKTPQPSSTVFPLPPFAGHETCFCRNCGAQIEITDNFCYKCGSKSPLPSFASKQITDTKEENIPAKNMPLLSKESSLRISDDPYAQHKRLYNRCKEIVQKYGFDPAALLPIKDMVDTAIRENVDLPDTDIEKMAHTAVFNSVAESLMLHKYADKDGFLALSIQGEHYINLLHVLIKDMVALGYLPADEWEDMMRNIMEVSHQRVYQEPAPAKSPAKTNTQHSSGISFWGILFFALIFIIPVIFLFFSMRSDTDSSPSATPTPTPSPTPTRVASTPVPTSTPYVNRFHVAAPPNGYMFKTPTYVKLCPLSVSVSGDASYYVYLEYLRPPGDSYNSRHLEGNPSVREEDIAFFVRPNSTVEIDVPVGVYKLYYAAGKEWYGESSLFGEDTAYSSSSDLLEFYTDYTTFYGSTLELWPQYNGNFDTHYIDEDDFPNR